MEKGLGCISKRTAAEQKQIFHDIIKTTLLEENVDDRDQVLNEIQNNLNDMIEEFQAIHEEEEITLSLSDDNIQKVLEESGMNERITNRIKSSCQEEFKEEIPCANHLIDTKAVEAAQAAKKEKRLIEQVTSLKNQLELKSNTDCEVSITIDPTKVDQKIGRAHV